MRFSLICRAVVVVALNAGASQEPRDGATPSAVPVGGVIRGDVIVAGTSPVLQKFSRAAMPITLAEGDSKTLQLELQKRA
jgi:hypothetical protein